MIQEFKKFAVKGNMVDMAIGVVIGAAFGTIVSSLVADIITPIISGVFNLPDFSNLFVVLNNTTGETFTSLEVAREAGVSVIAYGNFINAVISFLIIAWALFFVVKGINSLKEKEEAKEEPKGPSELEVLTEMRDLLKKNN